MPWRDYPAVQGSPPDNAEIASRLDQFASLLELAGAGPYTARAYRRAADLIRSTPAPVAELVRQGRVRELRGIGPGIERRLRELVETGQIAELEELEREVSPELAGLGRFLGVSVKRMLEIGRVLGVRSLAELREAAEAGRLQEVPGIGPETERKLRAALARERAGRSPEAALAQPQPAAGRVDRRGARRDRGRRPAPLARCLGTARRRRSAATQSVLDRFEALPQIVAVVERGDRRALGVTVEGVPVELVVAEPSRLGTELVRATGSPEWVAAHEPLPDAPDEESVFAALGLAVRAARAARGRSAGRDRPRRGGRDPRRPPLPLDLVGRQGDDPRDGPRRPRPRLRVPRDLRPHGQRRRRHRARRRRRAAAGRRDRRRQRGARAVPPPARNRVRHPPRRLARPSRRRAGRARLGAGERPRRPARLARGADQARARGARLAVRQLPQPSDRAADQPPAAERASTWRPSSPGSPSRAARSR